MKIKYKRFFAYMIDMFLISFFVSLIASSGVFANSMDKYQDANTRLEEKYKEILNTEDIESINEDDLDDMKAIVYDINSFGSLYFSLDLIAIIGYFTVFQFFNKGQTIGKKILKIRVKSKNSDNVDIGTLLLRTVLLYGVIFNIINMIAVEIFKVNTFYNIYIISNLLKEIILLSIFFMIIFRKDEKGLHDILTKTEVVECQ